MLRPVGGTHGSLLAPHTHCAHGAPPHSCRSLLFASFRCARITPQCSTAASHVSAAAQSPLAAAIDKSPQSRCIRSRCAAAVGSAGPEGELPPKRKLGRSRTLVMTEPGSLQDLSSKQPAAAIGQSPGDVTTQAAAAPPRRRGRPQKYKDTAWTPEVEADVLRFWTKRGVLLPAGQTAATAEAARQQRDLRRKLCKWARKHSWHRRTAYLEEKIAQWDLAAQSAGWGGDVNVAALADHCTILLDPIRVLDKLRQIEALFTRYDIVCSAPSTVFQLIRYATKTLEARLPAVLSGIAAWPVKVDPAHILAKYPNIINASSDFGVFEQRVRAMQQLHLQLDVAAVVTSTPMLLMLPAATLADKWMALHKLPGLNSSQVLELVHYQPALLSRNMTRVADKLHAVRGFESRRAAAGQPPAQLGFPSWVTHTAMQSDVKMLRLEFLLERADSGYAAALIKPFCIHHFAAGE